MPSVVCAGAQRLTRKFYGIPGRCPQRTLGAPSQGHSFVYRLGLLSPHSSRAEQLRQRLCDPENLTRAISGPSPTKSADPRWVPVARPGAEAASSTAIHNPPSEPLSALALALPCSPAPVSLGRPLGAQAPADSGWEVRAPRPVLPMLSPFPGAVRPTDGAGVGRRARAAEPVHRPPEPAGGGGGPGAQ